MGIEYLARREDGKEPDWPTIHGLLQEIRDQVDTHVAESGVAKEKLRKM